jgi:hypothetical protein
MLSIHAHEATESVSRHLIATATKNFAPESHKLASSTTVSSESRATGVIEVVEPHEKAPRSAGARGWDANSASIMINGIAASSTMAYTATDSLALAAMICCCGVALGTLTKDRSYP